MLFELLFLELYTLPNATTGLDDIVIQTIAAVPSLVPLLLLFTFCVVFLGGISRQIIRNGTADYPMWSTVASVATLMIALLMTLKEGFIDIGWVVIVAFISFFSFIWLYFDRKPSEI